MAVSTEDFMKLMTAQMQMNSEILNEIKELKKEAKKEDVKKEESEAPPGLEGTKTKEEK